MRAIAILSSNPPHNGRGGRVSGTRLDAAAFCALIFVLPLAAQTPSVRIVNETNPSSTEFQVGDAYRIEVVGAPNQAISIRSMRAGRIDWGSPVAWTNAAGRWSTSGRFENKDFGDWNQVWTIGGKLAATPIRFYVKAPCLPNNGDAFYFQSGINIVVTCVTAGLDRTFATPSNDTTAQTPDQYHQEILSHFITVGGGEGVALSSAEGGLGDHTADLIDKVVGANALTGAETRNVLTLMKGAFEKPESIAPDARRPWKSLAFLRALEERTDDQGVKTQIEETIAHLQTR